MTTMIMFHDRYAIALTVTYPFVYMKIVSTQLPRFHSSLPDRYSACSYYSKRTNNTDT